MLNDPEIDAIYEKRPTSINVYCNQLKSNVEQTAVFDFDDITLYSDSKGNKNKSIRVKILEPVLITGDDKRYENGEFYLVLPKITASYMFCDADIDIRKQKGKVKIKFKIKSQKKYTIIEKEKHMEVLF